MKFSFFKRKKKPDDQAYPTISPIAFAFSPPEKIIAFRGCDSEILKKGKVFINCFSDLNVGVRSDYVYFKNITHGREYTGFLPLGEFAIKYPNVKIYDMKRLLKKYNYKNSDHVKISSEGRTYMGVIRGIVYDIGTDTFKYEVLLHGDTNVYIESLNNIELISSTEQL
jgi:hypothetical protein